MDEQRPPRIKGPAATIREYRRHGVAQVEMSFRISLRGSLVYMVHDSRGPRVFTANGPLERHEGFEQCIDAEYLDELSRSLGVPEFLLCGSWNYKRKTWTLENMRGPGEHWRDVPWVAPWSPYITYPEATYSATWDVSRLEAHLEEARQWVGQDGQVMAKCVTHGLQGPRYWFKLHNNGAQDAS